MTQTEAAITALRRYAPNYLCDEVGILLAQRDRYKKALMEIDDLIDGITTLTHQIKKLAQKALRCE